MSSEQLPTPVKAWLTKYVRAGTNPQTQRKAWSAKPNGGPPIYGGEHIAEYLQTVFPEDLADARPKTLGAVIGEFLVKAPDGPHLPPILNVPQRQHVRRRGDVALKVRAVDWMTTTAHKVDTLPFSVHLIGSALGGNLSEADRGAIGTLLRRLAKLGALTQQPGTGPHTFIVKSIPKLERYLRDLQTPRTAPHRRRRTHSFGGDMYQRVKTLEAIDADQRIRALEAEVRRLREMISGV